MPETDESSRRTSGLFKALYSYQHGQATDGYETYGDLLLGLLVVDGNFIFDGFILTIVVAIYRIMQDLVVHVSLDHAYGGIQTKLYGGMATT